MAQLTLRRSLREQCGFLSEFFGGSVSRSAMAHQRNVGPWVSWGTVVVISTVDSGFFAVVLVLVVLIVQRGCGAARPQETDPLLPLALDPVGRRRGRLVFPDVDDRPAQF